MDSLSTQYHSLLLRRQSLAGLVIVLKFELLSVTVSAKNSQPKQPTEKANKLCNKHTTQTSEQRYVMVRCASIPSVLTPTESNTSTPKSMLCPCVSTVPADGGQFEQACSGGVQVHNSGCCSTICNQQNPTSRQLKSFPPRPQMQLLLDGGAADLQAEHARVQLSCRFQSSGCCTWCG